MSIPNVVDFLLAGVRDSSGDPLSAGKVYVYEAGTSTPKTVYQDVSLSTAHANPIVLDANGKSLVFGTGPAKFVIKDSDDNTLYTHDNYPISIGERNFHATSSGGTADALTLSFAESFSLQEGMMFSFKAPFDLNADATVNPGGLGNLRIVDTQENYLKAGHIFKDQTCLLLYDGSEAILISTGGESDSYIPTITAASGTVSNSSGTADYVVSGSMCTVFIDYEFDLSTSSASVDITLPFSSRAGISSFFGAIPIEDNSTVGFGKASLSSNDNTLTVTGLDGGAFSGNADTKVQGQFSYPIR